ncbi:MAG: neutral zinc metallopeptidase, partial [Arenicellales bacterium]
TQDQQKEFVSVVLADTEDTWKPVFKQLGREYREPKLVLFSGSTDSACGYASAAMGPFYCPGDQKLYIDLNFYSELQNKFGAPGDFAQAYVVAHEVGHHVQTLLGITDQVQRAKSGVSQTQSNDIQVRMELQADCLSGVWANHAHRSRKLLEQGDIEEGLRAAAAIGDDTLQRKSRGYVVPESFTHGSAKQRQTWFFRGLESGDINQCDTFSGQV